MKSEERWREQLLRVFFAPLILAVPILVAYDVYRQLRTPTLDFYVTGHGSCVISEVVAGGKSEAAGLRAGDAILTIDGTQCGSRLGLQLGQTYDLEIQRDGQQLDIRVPTIPVGHILGYSLASGATVVLIFWAIGTLLLLRRFQQGEVRLLFLLSQAIAVLLLSPLAHPDLMFVPYPLQLLSATCLYLVPPLLLHYYLIFPVRLGTPRQRRWVLGPLYGLALVIATSARTRLTLGAGLRISYILLQIIAAIVVLAYVYLWRATPDGRRRLRLIIVGTTLATVPPAAFYLVPISTGSTPRMPEWLTGLFLVIAPLSYLFATARHNLFGIDRLLNRALVFTILSAGIFFLYLGPLLLLYHRLPDDVFLQTTAIAGLTLLVGLSFNWARTQVQRLVDRLFYGGWYDYPGVVENVSDALARSLSREQLTDVLTRQVPELMQLHPGHLRIDEPDQSPNLQISQSPHLQLPLTFQGQVRSLWTVGLRRDGEDFSPADVRILKTLARQAEIALSNVLLVETLRRQLEQIREAQHQLLRSREEERARLARDLHDGPIQALVGLNIQLGLLAGPLGGDNLPLTTELGAMRAEVRALLTELRHMCAELRPPMLDTLGLSAALRALADDWSNQSGVTIHLDLPTDAELRFLPNDVAVNLYRVVQEGLNNVTRHAQAQQVTIQLACEDAHLALTLADDGQGFLVPPAFHDLAAQGHFGLVGMQERIDLIGGTWTLESIPGQGTTVRIVWPKVSPSSEST